MSTARTTAFLIIIEPVDDSIFTINTFNAIAELTEAAWNLSYVTRVDSINNCNVIRSLDDNIDVSTIYDAPLKYSEESQLPLIKKTTLKQKMFLNHLVSSDGKYTAINIVVELPKNDQTTETIELVKEIEGALKTWQVRHPHLKHLPDWCCFNESRYQSNN